MVCCLHGAKTLGFLQQLQTILKGECEQPEVIVNIGTKNIGKKRDVVFQSEYREIGKRLIGRTSSIVISDYSLCHVPVEDRPMNMWLMKWCRGKGFQTFGSFVSFQGWRCPV